MFGHLRPEEFLHAIEGIEGANLPPTRQAHLHSCVLCQAQLRSLTAVHRDFATEDRDIPEPEWDSFRDSVRLELLSRAVQRESAVRRWTGWSIRPAMALGLSLVLICVSVGGVLWHARNDANRSESSMGTDSGALSIRPLANAVDGAELEQASTWTTTSVFEQLSNLEEPQAERLRTLIETAQNGVLKLQ